jgi:hypothetical protein
LVDFLFVLLVIGVGALLMYVATTTTSLQVLVNGVPLELPDVKALETEVWGFLQSQETSPVQTEVLDFTRIERTNLVEDLPVPTPLPTPTSIPDPVFYRNEVMLRARHFANTLESFFEQNEKLRGNPDLMRQEDWLREMQVRLDMFAAAAWNLGMVEPAPDEYQALQSLLKSAGPHAQNMRDNYLLGIQQESQDHMRVASDELDKIYEVMAQVQAEMVKAGWQP